MPLKEMLARRKLAEAVKELREANADYEDTELRMQADEVGSAAFRVAWRSKLSWVNKCMPADKARGLEKHLFVQCSSGQY